MGSRRVAFALSAIAGLVIAASLAPRRASADEPFTEEVARRLLPKAAELDTPEAWNVIQALGAAVTLTDLRAGEAFALPYVAMILSRQTWPPNVETDFRLAPSMTPVDMATAMNGGKPVERFTSTNGVSLLRPEYIRRVVVKQDGARASGEVDFEAPGVYRGHLLFEAMLAAGSWHVTGFEFPVSGAKIKWSWGKWSEVRMPDATAMIASGAHLPTVSSVGPAPDVHQSIAVVVTPWAVHVGGQEVRSFSALDGAVVARARSLPRERDGSSAAPALIVADEDAPWTMVQWVMQTLASPRAKFYKVHFAAVHRASGEIGALRSDLPKDRGFAATPVVVSENPQVKVRIFARGEEREAGAEVVSEAVFAKLVQLHRQSPEAKFEIATPLPSSRQVRFGIVLRVVEAGLAAGFREIEFEGAPSPLPRARGDDPLQPFGRGRAGSDSDLADALRTLRELPRGRVKLKIGHDFESMANGPAAKLPDGPAPSRQRAVGPTHMATAEAPPEEELPATPEEAEQVHGSDLVAKEPTVKDAELSDHNETDNDLPTEESLGEGGLSDAPFEGPADNGLIGIGGGAGGAFKGRGGHRNLRNGGARRTDDAVEHALKWLAAHQSADGGWEAEGFPRWCDGKASASGSVDGAGKATYDVGVTGLALLAYLGSGYTNRGDHPFARVVARGLRYLKNVQDAEGCFGPRTSGHYIYNHAIAAAAIVEAYGMTGSPIYKGSAQKALDFIALARNPYFAWRYGVKPGDNDTSVTGWMMLALKAAKWINEADAKAGKPASLMIDEEAFEGIRAWVDKMTDPDYGRVGYQQRGTGPARPVELVDKFPADKSEAMTAVGMLARVFVGESPHTSEPIQKGATLLAKLPPTWNPNDGSIDMDYWHFGTMAMFQVGGDPWRRWEAAMKPAFVDTQRLDTDYCQFKGSWDPIDPWGPDGGRVYSTAMMAMSLQATYRYERIFAPPAPPQPAGPGK